MPSIETMTLLITMLATLITLVVAVTALLRERSADA
jgi:hypothetical protein